MKRFVFPYSISFGKQDNVDGQISFALSDANAKRLVRSAEEGRRHRLDEDTFISDIYVKVSNAVEKKLTEQLMEDPAPVIEALSWNESFDPNKRIGIRNIREYLDEVMISVYFPEEMQLLETKGGTKTNSALYVIMDEEQALEQIKKEKYNSNVIVLTDEGKTLFHVPVKFSGPVTIPASVRKIRAGFSQGAFWERKSVSEIIIEDGLPEIKEWTFSRCEGLKKVIIPGSVKRIGHLAFSGCSSLREMVLPEGLEEIYYSSFDRCNLESISLSSTLKLMYKMNIRNIYFHGKNTEITEALGCNWNRTTLHVLPGSVAEQYAINHGISYTIMRDAVKC